jgi:hypothetical protein
MMHKLFTSLTLALMLCSLLAACAEEPAEQQLRRQLQTMQDAIENKQAGDFLDIVADEYRDKQGGNKQSLKKLMLFHMLRNRKIGVYLANVQVEVTGQTAEITMQAGLTGGQGILPDRARLYKVITRWRYTSGDWLLYYAEWEPV